MQRELGRSSLAFGRARGVLEQLWRQLGTHPEVALKRQLWDSLLREVYGIAVGDDSLFLQHTYLTIVAKTVAARVLDLAPDDAESLLSGRLLAAAGIHGAVESDFFDWVLQAPEGGDLVRRLAQQTARFRQRDAEADVLKALYESLIDPPQRHDLGEYYTPDWLAGKIVKAAVTDPLNQRVLDPACGSGTFLFHAVRRLLATAEAVSWPRARAIEACTGRVRGLDIHPVAVIIARVTWLLALGKAINERPTALHVPVYLGDALQWNLRQVGEVRDVVVPVPNDRPLHVPVGFAEDQAKFDTGLRTLTEGLREQSSPEDIERSLRRIPGASAEDAAAMSKTFAQLQELYREGRNSIWPFVLRNLVRPVWLSRPEQQADVVVGNPPWVAYRYLSPEMKARVREACQGMNLWVGGVLATQQDVSALFWARSAQRYLKRGGTIAFVMPYAALNRPAFEGLRRGDFRAVSVRILDAWSFDETVQPLFEVPSAVLIGRRDASGNLPARVERYTGALPRRDATETEADRALHHAPAPWPQMAKLEAASPYRERFRQGATIVPRRFFFVERIYAGRLGPNPAAPLVRGKVSSLDKRPWSDVPPEGPVEQEFIGRVLLGESIAPFRVLRTLCAVIPFQRRDLLDSQAARNAGYRHLAAWLREIEAKWAVHCAKRTDGTPRMTLRQQLDHLHKLTVQFPLRAIRVIYSALGTLPSAVVVKDSEAIVEHGAYWASMASQREAHYVAAIINSEATRGRIQDTQARGQWGARHFDKVVWELRIPLYDSAIPLHRQLATAGARAERVAASVQLPEGVHFTRQRRAIRVALAASGVAATIDALVEQLLAR